MLDSEPVDELVFVNRFKGSLLPLEYHLPIIKHIKGEARTESDKETFFFRMTPIGVAPEPEAPQISIRDVGIEEFTIIFEAPGTYEYQVTELEGMNPAYRYDKSKYTIQLVVEEDMQTVHCTIQKNGKTAESVVFPNTFGKGTTPYEWTFTKLWVGGHEDGLNWTMYNEAGNQVHKGFNKYVVNENEWKYSAWFAEPNDYYIIEDVPAGYVVIYVNVGEHADVTDRCYNGGTIINKIIPKTGDNNHPILYAIALLMSLGYLLYAMRRRS